jgi:hypothetical protein
MAFRSEKAGENDYSLLGVSSSASRREVKAAYRRLAKEWHPDRFHQRSLTDREAAEEKFKALTSAYRRIAGGWLEEETTRGKSSPKCSPQHGAGETAGRSAGAGHHSAGPAPVFSWLGTRPGLLSLGLLLAVAAFLFFIRLDSSSVRQDKMSPAAPDLPVGSSSLSAPLPDSDLENPPGIQSAPEPSPPSEAPQQSRRPETPETAPGAGTSPGAPHSELISMGSTQEDVLRIQGPPQVVRGQTWVYGVSELGFKEGRVVRYNNFDGSLRVRVLPSRGMPSPPPSFYTIGSSADDVLAVQGTPTRMDGNRWTYGFSEIRFKDGKVEEYDNFFGDLKVQLSSRQTASAGQAMGFFTVGSTADEVLAVQGTPTSIRGNLWYYQMSSVLFRKGKVHYVFNSSGNLRFVPKEELSRSE